MLTSDLELALALPRQTACAVCAEQFSSSIVQSQHTCPEHVSALCETCIGRHVAAQGPVPRCPMPMCEHELSEADMRVFGDLEAVQAWHDALLERAMPTLGGIVVACPQIACPMKVLYEGAGRSSLTCPV